MSLCRSHHPVISYKAPLISTQYYANGTGRWVEFSYIFMSKEHGGHGLQGLPGPGHEPVDAAVVDHAREVSAAGAQRVAHGGHGQHHVQVVDALADVVLPDGLADRRDAMLTRLVSHLR